MYFILKLYIQNHLPNTTKWENECFIYLFFIKFQEIEYRVQKMKSEYTTFWNQINVAIFLLSQVQV